MNIVLVGMMGSGKTSVGQALAKLTGRRFVDTDALLEERTGRSIPAIFAADGEAVFRTLESSVIMEVVSLGDLIIATGGGAVLAPANREALRRTGRVFWLDAPATELYQRAVAQGIAGRPLLVGEDPLGRLTALRAARAEAYGQAAHDRVETAGRSPAEVAALILDLLKETT